MADETFSDDGVQDYLKNIATHRILTREEEVALFQRVEANDATAREEVVRCNLRLVVKIALQFRHFGVPMADLIQEGNIGLLTVISKFDWRRGFRFSTYAAFWIRQEIQAALRHQNAMIRLPIRKARLAGKISEVTRHFATHEGRDPSAEEIALFLGVDAEQVRTVQAMREPVLSLDAERAEDGLSLLHAIPHDAPAPYERLNQEQTQQAVSGVLRYLTDRERHIVELRFGLHERKALSLRKTSRMVGLSQEGVRRIERRALDKLQRGAIRRQLEGLLTA